MNKSIRAAAVERSEGHCEACGKWAGEAAHCDHFFGRGHVAESLATVWMLCPSCDHHKTVNDPSNRWWVCLFESHAAKHGYADEVHRCEIRLEVLTQKGLCQ